MKLLTLISTATLAVTCLCTVTATAAEWKPTKNIRFIVPFAPGAFGDVSARLIAPKMSQSLGQTIIVENRVGASGSIGTELGARAPADGYTWTLGADPSMTLYPHLQKVAYDPFKDFMPVGLVAVTPLVLIVNSKVPVKSFTELMALAKSKPGQLTMGSSGNGTPPHITAEMFRAAGMDVLHVPYSGQAMVTTDLIAGRVDMTVTSLPAAASFLKAERVKILAISSTKRLPSLPDVPTFRELGYPGFEFRTWVGLFVPAGTPQNAVQRIESELAKALAQKDVSAKFEELGYEAPNPTVAALKEIMKANDDRFGALIKKSGMTLN